MTAANAIYIDPEFESLIPPLTGEERAQLEQNIINHGGARDRLIVWPNDNGLTLIDGHNRYRICTENALPFDIIEQDFDDRSAAVEYIIRNQFGRRNIPNYVRAELALRLEGEIAARAKANQQLSEGRGQKGLQISADLKPVDTRQELAKVAGVSHDTIAKVKKIDQAAKEGRVAPEVIEDLRRGETTINKVAGDITREEKRAQIRERLETIAAQEAVTPTGLYDVIVMDPPWPMEKIERDVRPNQSEFDYPTMTEAELEALEIPAEKDCHFWLWTTHKFLPMALRLLQAWGFKYVCTFVWHKPGGFQPIGLPQFNCEFAIYARKGSPSFIDTKAFSTCFDAPRGGHSEKPEPFYDMVRRVTGGRRLDMFNRRKIEGFNGWGNEAA